MTTEGTDDMAMADLRKWLLGAITALIMLGVSMIAAGNNWRLEHLDAQMDRQDSQSLENAVKIHGLEVNYADITRRLERIEAGQDRMNTKLDAALGSKP